MTAVDEGLTWTATFAVLVGRALLAMGWLWAGFVISACADLLWVLVGWRMGIPALWALDGCLFVWDVYGASRL